jgi:predicted PhzF superfamily epimerase YddE/YHI9
MSHPMYQVDAFTGELFHGNPAAVVMLPEWLPDATLQAVAAENNLAETAFVVPAGERFKLRWFTPELEIDLCGHATLASAFALLEHGYAPGPRVVFDSVSGELAVEREGELLVLDFPSRPASTIPMDPAVGAALGAAPVALMKARDVLAVFGTEAEVRALEPDFAALARGDALGVIVTAPGTDCDFVSRFFAPRAGIPEDPVTGSAHCTLVPYWSHRLGKAVLHARQVSARGGELFCEDRGSRVRIAGHAVEYLQGQIVVSPA